ncbi:MAG: hypothetical protein HY815_31815 [Candidatus Riflebacteria bacterium]|nr:hypothetical protein [Candidatus Riflebacteria bacterium]
MSTRGRRLALVACWALAGLFPGGLSAEGRDAAPAGADRLAAVRADHSLEMGGVNVVAVPESRECLLVAVARAQALGPGASAREGIDQGRILDARAQATISRFLRAEISTSTAVTSERQTVTSTGNGAGEVRAKKCRRVALEVMERTSGVLPRIIPIGTWTSTDGTQIFVAVAVEVTCP